MDRISHFNKILEEIFNKYLYNYFLGPIFGVNQLVLIITLITYKKKIKFIIKFNFINFLPQNCLH